MMPKEEMVYSCNFRKVRSIIDSIDSPLQLAAGERLIELFYLSERDALDEIVLMSHLNAKKRELGVEYGLQSW